MNPNKVSPAFFIPPNVEGLSYDDSNFDVPDSGDTFVGDAENTEYVDGPGTEGEEGTLLPPDYVTIVSQTVHTSASGTQLVDVVIEVEDVPGAIQYDMRLTRQ